MSSTGGLGGGRGKMAVPGRGRAGLPPQLPALGGSPPPLPRDPLDLSSWRFFPRFRTRTNPRGSDWMASAKEGASGQGATENHRGVAKEGGDDAELRLILVGKSGGGKSATGNTILRRKAFKSLLAAQTTTVKFQKEQGTWEKETISVIDTPAIFDSEVMERSLEEQLENCREMCQSGLHAFILVTQVGRFTAEDVAAAKRVQKIFGPQSTSRMIVLFTCKEDLGGDSLKEYVEQTNNRHLRDLMKKCHNRFHGFNNKAEGEEQEKQVSELMKMVKEIVKEHQGISPQKDQNTRKFQKYLPFWEKHQK